MTAVSEAKRVYEFDTFRLDPAERLLLRAGLRVQLPPKAFDALMLLIENSGRVVSKEEFFAKVWPDSLVEQGSLTVVISMIRKSLGEGQQGRKYVETVSKRGYRFLAQVRETLKGSHEGLLRTAQDVREMDMTKQAANLRSIAVLPFKAFSAATSNGFLQMGLADAIITRLSNLRQFIVRPTSAVTRYEGAQTDLLTAGREMGVDWILEGYMQQADERIRVTVQLVNTSDGSPVWADRFDEEFRDIFAVDDSISERVAMTLLDHLSGEEKTRLTKHHTEKTEAYHAYLKGRYFWNKYTEEGVDKAFGWF